MPTVTRKQPLPMVLQRKTPICLQRRNPVRVSPPAVIQRMEDRDARKLRKAQSAGKYSVDQQKQLEKQMLKTVPSDKVAKAFNQAVTSLPSQTTSKIGHGSADTSSNTRGGNDQAVGGFFGAVGGQFEKTSESPARKPATTFSKKKIEEARAGNVVEKRQQRKEKGQQQRQVADAHQRQHEGNRNDISVLMEPRKPFDRNIDGVRKTYDKCKECKKYWIPQG